jgi:twitching motility two-component system response regulator PilG
MVDHEQKLVMVIDDSLLVRKIVAVTARRQELDCVGYADGVEALRAIHERRHRMPDLILLDIGVPHLDGYRLLAHFHTPQFAATPVIILSGRGGVLDRLCTRLAGAVAYIEKPFRVDQLVDCFVRYLHITPMAVYAP